MNIGLLGFGVVGRGVYDMLAGRDDIRAAWVLCRRDLGQLARIDAGGQARIQPDPRLAVAARFDRRLDALGAQRRHLVEHGHDLERGHLGSLRWHAPRLSGVVYRRRSR